MIKHEVKFEEVPNSWLDNSLSYFIDSVVIDHSKEVDAYMKRFGFTINRPVTAAASILTSNMWDAIRTGSGVIPTFPPPLAGVEEEFGFPYLGEIVELTLPTLLPYLMYQQYEEEQLPDVVGHMMNLILARYPHSTVSAHKVVLFFDYFCSEEVTSRLLARYMTFMSQLKDVLDAAGLRIHFGVHTRNHQCGLALCIPGTLRQVAQALHPLLAHLPYTCEQHQALLLVRDCRNHYVDLLLYDELGEPDPFNMHENVDFEQQVLAFYRKRKLRYLIS